MKPMKTGIQTVKCSLPVVADNTSRHALPASIANRKSQTARAFTLVELLAVITVIAVIAAFTFPVLTTVKIHQYESTTEAEMAQLETAIDSYHAYYGFYPPDNSVAFVPTTPNTAVTSYDTINQLYFELVGVYQTNDSNGILYETLDNRSYIYASQASVTFGTPGFANCNKPGASEETRRAQSFLTDLKPNQYATNGVSPGTVNFLTPSVGGPDVNYAYRTLGLNINPWRYNSSSPTNNPGKYDLWAQLFIGGKKYLICNWSKQVQVNNPLP
jgi:prepilin-type N-terminal cleavage/methylation domain-containing protein